MHVMVCKLHYYNYVYLSTTGLPGCKLSVYLESRVNNFLKKKNIGAGEVVIRVLASGDKETEVKQTMRDRFPDLPASYPYRTKAMFAFEEIDGQEVCFFGMHVQEYDDKCCQPNRGRVYISYLDSVHFFQPREYRTAVYHEILIGYLDYCKTLGFNWGHIWACPPSEGDDYIFHCHPSEQKIPKPKRLQDWYKKMLDKVSGIVIYYCYTMGVYPLKQLASILSLLTTVVIVYDIYWIEHKLA